MSLFRLLAALAVLAINCPAHADTDCADPISDWKPREVLRQQVEARGWTVQRIKVDDGCYEVRGTDQHGNRVKAKYGPATLRMRSLEIDFGERGDPSDYFCPPRPGAEHRTPGTVNKGKNQ